MIKKLIIILVFIICIIWYASAMSTQLQNSDDTSQELIDNYWENHQNEDPCNTVEATVWGLCP